MNNLLNKLQNLGGNLELSVICIEDASRLFYLLLQDSKYPKCVCSLVFQTSPSVINKDLIVDQNNGIYFVESLDSTGYFEPIELKSHFIKSFFRIILQSIYPNYVEIFSHPKNEIVFHKSSLNKNKKILEPYNLLHWWINTCKGIENYTMQVYSSHLAKKDHPFKKMLVKNIVLFDDDPKRKMANISDPEMDADSFFESILFRKDVSRGGFIFLKTEKKFEKLSPEINYGAVPDVLKFLRNSDFCSNEANEKSTRNFLFKFQITPYWIATKNIPCRKSFKDDLVIIKTLKTRKKSTFKPHTS